MSDRDRRSGDATDVAPDGSPVDLYARWLPSLGEAELAHEVGGAGATILELGCGAGRVTRGLVELGHPVVAVDNSPAMLARLDHLRGVEAVCAEVATLDLRTMFDIVLLGSHMVNEAEDGLRRGFLGMCRRHVTGTGAVLIERMDPRWAEPAWVAERTVRSARVGEVEVTLHDVHLDPPLLTETVEYAVPDGRRWRQGPFVARILGDGALGGELRTAGLRLERWLRWRGTDRIWCVARPDDSDADR